MTQTPEGARKVNARRLGMTLEDYERRIETEAWCNLCKTWELRSAFGADSSRHDGLSRHCLASTRVKARKDTKGRPGYFKGHRHSGEARAAMSRARKGRPSGRVGMRHTVETRKLISERVRGKVPSGPASRWWKGGTARLHHEKRVSPEYKEWRRAVFERDCFTCQWCGDAQGGNLRAHHVKSYADYPDLRLDVSNGVTVCVSCHDEHHRRGCACG